MLPSSMTWLNTKFFEKVLKKSENDGTIEVENSSVTFDNAIGDHSSSDIIRASVDYFWNNSDGRRLTDKKYLFIKVAATLDPARKQCVAETKVFAIEIKMMELLELMNQLLNEEGYRLNARALYTENGDPSLLVFEDLASLGYRMANRLAGLDFDQCILAMKGLAKFHASSVALYEMNPNVAKFRHGIFYTNVSDQIKNLFVNGFKVFANEILGWPEFESSGRIFSEKILKLSDSFFEKGRECFEAKPGEFNVLNHGDCWSNNMLFRYNDEGKVIDHIFVDFQMCCWATPLLDILMFLNSSTTEDVELYHRNALLEEYLQTLTKTMTRIGCKTKAPTMSVLVNIQPKYEILSVMTSCVGLPMVFHNTRKAIPIDEMLQISDGVDTDVFERPDYRRRVIRRLRVWNANGVFDI